MAVMADRLILGCLAASCLLSLAIGQQYDTLAIAAIGAACLAILGAGAFLLAPGTVASSVLLSSALMASVALHIDLARGVTELHFGVFVTLALLLVYRDGRPLLAAAALVAVHHFAFDRLQAAGLGVYCTAQPDVLRIVAHAGYVVVQTGVELLIVRHMRQAARQGDEMAALVARLSRDDQVSLDVHGIDARTPLGDGLKRALLRLNDSLLAVRAGVIDIERAAGDVASGNRDLSLRTERMASHLQQTASSTEQLAGHVKQSAHSAADANALALRTAEAAVRGGQAMSSVVRNMDRIAEASHRIGDVIGVVDSIAFQTNILALNAAVEAARAGEQGRGFAVVAGEVRVLAGRSAEAAREIKALIGRSVETVESGTRLVQDAGSAIDGIVTGVKKVSGIVRQISAASSEQSGGIDQINTAVSGLDHATQQNAALVDRSAAAAASLAEQAQRLARAVSQFRLAEA